MGKRFLVVTFIIGALLVFLAGCDNDPEQMRSVVTVASLNNNASLMSDVLEQGDEVVDDDGIVVLDDDYIAEDWVPVMFFNRPYSGVVSTGPGRPHGDFLITRYTVQWERTDGGTATLPDFTGGLGILVPSGEFVEGMIQLVTFENKMSSLIGNLCYLCTNAGDEVFMNAHITFYGHELGTDRETSIEALLGVAFVDIVIKSEN